MEAIKENNKQDIAAKKEERNEEEAVAEGLKLVIDQAKIKCDFCVNPEGVLKVNFDTPTTQDKKTATVVEKDMKSLIFTGNCKKSPNMALPCASVMQLGEWQNTGTLLVQDKSPLLKQSTIPCLYGGSTIEITDSGQRNVPSNVTTAAAPIPATAAELIAVYFGKKVVTPLYEEAEETVTAKKGENQDKITARFISEQKLKKEHVLSYTPEKAFKTAVGGETVKIKYRKKTKDILSFEKVKKIQIKKKVWVVAVYNGDKGNIAVEIKENKLTNAEAVYDSSVPFLIDKDEKTTILIDVAKDKIEEPNLFAKEITLQPKSTEDLKAQLVKFNKRTDHNAFLYLKAEVSNTAATVKYPDSTHEFINKDNERLELLGTPCYCNRDIEVDEMLDIIYNLRDKQNYKSKREVFFDRGGEYISAIRVESGTLTENKDKIKLFTDEMNAMFKKFSIKTCKRKIHFLGQMYLETISFQYTYESRSEVPDNYKGGVAFQGRGMKQITHDYNYLAYYDYVNSTSLYDVYIKHRSGYESVGECVKKRAKANSEGLDAPFYETLKTFAKNISENLFHSFNSAGWFSTVYKTATINAMDGGLADADIEAVTTAINGGLTNIAERKSYTKWTKEFFKYDTECVNK